ncbi:exported hypothetical protein [Bradyrhizobium sp. STM 3843]|uniref:hypothetical protein n=1 Tax=Bradyrhizobium sp. STM 3843 TaxID=551947 RepID=UPI000240777C|nr:hypothetical protein [Bradyrhizobium sp. STM 3843]CCE07324.1 exported hypothetical protein [Bradyrhizobium sp. STM 3843]
MKQKIPASAIAGIKNFHVAAAAHAAEMRSWRAHMARVEDDQKNDVPIERRHVAYPRPRAHPLIESVLDENDDLNFEVVDYGPTTAERLAARKAELMSEVSLAESRAIDAVVPPGKRRLFNLRETAIRTADNAKATELFEANSGLLKKITGAVLTTDQIAARVEAERAPEDTTLLKAQDERRERIAAIEMAAAQAHHDIEGLTAETIGSWKLPTF